ncbi:MAG: hypothetical protein ACOYI8_02930 [Christensenellales bacterium]
MRTEIMRTLLGGRPENGGDIVRRLRAMGIDGTEEELATNANLLGLTLMDRGLAGDIRAIKMAFEMAEGGEARDAEDTPTIVTEE